MAAAVVAVTATGCGGAPRDRRPAPVRPSGSASPGLPPPERAAVAAVRVLVMLPAMPAVEAARAWRRVVVDDAPEPLRRYLTASDEARLSTRPVLRGSWLAPLAVRSSGASRARRVDVWLHTVVAVDGAAALSGRYSVERVDLRWTAGGWRVVAYSSMKAPAPAIPMSAAGVGAALETLAGFGPVP